MSPVTRMGIQCWTTSPGAQPTKSSGTTAQKSQQVTTSEWAEGKEAIGASAPRSRNYNICEKVGTMGSSGGRGGRYTWWRGKPAIPSTSRKLTRWQDTDPRRKTHLSWSWVVTCGRGWGTQRVCPRVLRAHGVVVRKVGFPQPSLRKGGGFWQTSGFRLMHNRWVLTEVTEPSLPRTSGSSCTSRSERNSSPCHSCFQPCIW